jgi:hypothetical protein
MTKPKAKYHVFDDEGALRRHFETRCREHNVRGELTTDPDVLVNAFNSLFGLSPKLRAMLVQTALRYMAEEFIHIRDAEQEAAQ